MAKKEVTPKMLEALVRMREHGERIERRPGGFWCPPDTKPEGAQVGTKRPAPEWWCPVNTVAALERRGLVERANKHREAWKDDRILTPEGRAVALRALQPGYFPGQG